MLKHPERQTRLAGSRPRWTVIALTILVAFLVDSSAEPASATDALRELAEHGNIRLQRGLGEALHLGILGESKDDAQAVVWFRKAADQGDAEAQFYLGDAYYKGWGVKQNTDTGLKLYRRAAEQGYFRARGELRTLYVKGKLVPSLDLQAGPWWRLFAKEASAESVAFSKALAAAKKGDPPAQLRLGRLYLTGVGTSKDHDKAAMWLGRAAEHGQLEAQCISATLTTAKAGWRDASDNARAIELCLQAGSKGSADAQEILYYASQNALGAEQSDTVAAAWLRSAAEQGRADAEWRLATCYRDGDGVPKDEDQANVWYWRAAQQNQPQGFGGLANQKHLKPDDIMEFVRSYLEYYSYDERDFIYNIVILP